jgi:hypothetical protein
MSVDSMQQTPVPTAKPSTSERLKALVAEWGALLAVVWFSLFAIVLVGFALAIQLGFETESTAGTLGTWGAAYVATQLTKPLRLAATVLITPALGALLKRFRRPQAPAAPAEPAEPTLDKSASER